MSAVERFRIRSRGADLSCVRFGAGSPLLCAHALAFSKEYFASAADVLGRRFDCVAVDQRGHGDTEWEGGDAGLTLDAMADDIGRVLDYVGWKRAIVGGISLGAATTLRFALGSPDRLVALIQDLPAFGPTSPRNPRATEAVSEALDRSDFEGALGVLTSGLSRGRAKALGEALRSQWAPFGATLGPKLAAAFRATDRWRIADDWPGVLKTLDAPVRILGLRGDAAHPFEVAETMARTLPRARLDARVPSLSAEAVARQWLEVASNY